VVSISSAAPVGSHTITIRATDNCGATTDASFTQTVGNNPPQITAAAPLTRQQGSAGTVSTIATVSDTETAAGSLVVTATTVPAGLTVTSITNTGGAITATVAAGCTATLGANTVVLTVTDGNSGTATANLTINVTANTAPTLTYGNQSVAVGGALTISPATGPSDNGAISSIVVQSQGAYTGTISVNNGTGVISLSGAQPGGVHTITIRATDNCGATTDASFTLTVNCPVITLSPATLPVGTIGAVYSQTLTASGGASPYSFSIIVGSLPPNLVLSGSGVISGASTQSGTFNFTVQVTDASGCTVTQAYALVIGACPAITITPGTLPGGAVGVAYSQTLTATGGTPPHSFSLDAGSSLPPGLALSPGGAISGAPTTAGSFGFTVKVTDQNGCVSTKTYTVVICATITISPSNLPSGFVGAAYNQTLTQTGGVGAINWSVSAGALPGGLSLGATTGVLSGTPAAQGTFAFTITATDANNCFGERSYTVIINGGGLMYYPLPRPIRLLDTRAGEGACDSVGTPIIGGTSITKQARGACEGITIPANAQAIVGTVTVVNLTSQAGYLTLYPNGVPAPLVSNMVYNGNEILSTAFTLGLSAGGEFNIFAQRTLEAIVDVSGYYAPPGAGGLYFHPLPRPLRLLDTRAGEGLCDSVGTPIAAGTSITKQARLTCEGITIPAAAQALAANATVVNLSPEAGYLTLYPNGVPVPLVSNMVYQPNQILSNAFNVSLSAAGEFNIFAQRALHAVIDVAGYYSDEAVDVNGPGLLFNPLPRPLRLLDTRAGQGLCDSVGTPVIGGTFITKLALITCEGITIAGDTQALVGTVTAVNLTNLDGYMTLYPNGVPAPLISNMIYAPNRILSNAFVVGLSAAGEFNLFSQRTIEGIVDVSGYFAP
jgi:hypothetical protein